MNHLLDDTEVDRDEAESHGDREISLGPGTILGIFFALAVVCGAFLALGYSMGRHAAQNAPAPVIVADNSPAIVSGTKPAAGSAAVLKPAPADADASDTAPPAAAAQRKVSAADGVIVGDRIVAKTTPPAPSAQAAAAPAPAVTAAGALPAIAPDGTFMVQVAAVSSKDIADIELNALKKFNYPVVVRHEPQDQLLHIQIGPFATKKDAEAMRQNVLSHGFNAIVKQ